MEDYLDISDGEKLYVTSHYAFNYNESELRHIIQFDILTQFFEKSNNLKGFMPNNGDPYIEEGSEVDILMDDLSKAFQNKEIPKLVEEKLHKYEMYEVLADYIKPLTKQGEKFRDELIGVINK